MNLDILIRIRDQLTGLNRAQQGLRDLNAQVAGSSKQWTQMAAGALGVTAAVGLLGAEIRHVVANIDQIPGIPQETVTTINMAKANMEEFRGTLDRMIAGGVELFAEVGQGLGYLAGAAVYGWDAAGEAYADAERAALAAAEAARKAEEQQRKMAETAKALQALLPAIADAQAAEKELATVGETSGEKFARLGREIAAMNAQLATAKDEEVAKLSAGILRARAEQKRIELALDERANRLADEQLDFDLQQYSATLQLTYLEPKLIQLRAERAKIDLSTLSGKEAELDITEKILALEKKIAAAKQAAEGDEGKPGNASQARQLAAQDRLRANTLALGAVNADYTKTEAEKWGERKRIIEDSIAAQQRYIASQQQIADDPTRSSSERADASREVASGTRDLGDMQNQLAGLGPDPFSTIEQLKASLTSLKESWGTTAQQIAQGFSGVIGTAMQGTSDALYDWISGAATAKDAWLGALQSIGQSFLRMITDMVAKMIWRSTVERALIALGVMTHVQGETAKTAATTTGGGIRLLTGIKEALASVYKGALFAFEALASIPYVGPFLGAAAMAAAIAGGIALVSKIGHADGGYIAGPGSGTSDSIPAMLSNGEYVIPADKVQQYGRGFFDSIRSGSFLAGAAPSNNSALQSYGIAAAVAPAAAPESGAGGVGEMAIGVFDRRTAMEDFFNSKRGQKILFDAHRNTARQIG